MITRFPIVVLALFVILVEVRSLSCYVCDKCPPDSADYANITVKEDCLSCVIEDRFNSLTYMQTNRSCAKCPGNKLEMTNNIRSFYHCCDRDRCLGSKRWGLEEINRTAEIIARRRQVNLEGTDIIFNGKNDNPKSKSKVEDKSAKPTTETTTQTPTGHSSVLGPQPPRETLDTTDVSNEATTSNTITVVRGENNIQEPTNKSVEASTEKHVESATQNSESSSTATHKKSVASQDNSSQPSDTSISSTETAGVKSIAPGNTGKSIPDAQGKRDDQSSEQSGGSAKENLGPSSTPADQSSVLRPELPTKPLDNADMSNKASASNPITVARGEDVIREPREKSVEESMKKAAESATQNMESSSPRTCHTGIWYLVFSVLFACVHLVYSN